MDLPGLLARHCTVDRGADGLFLPGWGAEDWHALVQHASTVALGAGEPLMRHGEEERALYLVASGALEVTSGSRRSESWSTLYREKPGSVVGEISFFDGLPRTASVWATEPTVLLRIDAAGLDAFGAEHPTRGRELLFALARVLAFRARRSDQLSRAPSLY